MMTPMRPLNSPDPQPSNRGQPLIYVVDDEAMVVTMIDAILKNQGYEVKLFRDPHLCLKAFGEADSKPVVLVADFVMGSMNGLELIEKCRQLSPKLKSLLISGSIQENFVRQSWIKPDHFLTKPFEARVFLDAVRKLANA